MSANKQSFIIFTESQLEDFANKIIQKVQNSFSFIGSKPKEKKLLTKEDFKNEYGFTLGTINKMVFEKEIEYVKPNNKIHFTRKAIEDYIEKHTQNVGVSK